MGNRIVVTDNYIEIRCDKNDMATLHKLAQFYPVHSNRSKTIHRLSVRNLPEVLWIFRGIGEHNIEKAPYQIQQHFYKEIRRRENTKELLKNGPRKPCKVSDLLTLRVHQQLGRELAEYNDRFAFYYDTRTGKTPLALTIINDDIQKNSTHKWVVICPLILIYNAWIEDAKRFFPNLKVVNCHAKTVAKRKEAFKQEGNIYIINTESFVRYKEYVEKLNAHGCFVDESSSMKSPRSKVSKAIVDYAQTVKRFYLLSGTPAPNGEWEYYMQMRAIDYYGWQPSYTQFKLRYFVNLSYEPQYEKLALRPDKKEELYNRIKEYALYVDKEDVLDTPGRTFYVVECQMPPELMKHYRKLKNELYLELGDNIQITAPSAGAKLNKLNQVTSGFIIDTQAVQENKLYGTNKPESYLLSGYRFKKLQELLNQKELKDKQVLIWANYRKEFEIIKEMLGDKCACVYGATSLEEKNKAIKDFKQGKIQYLVANPASADKGLTLTNCHICIYFSLNWSYELFKQSYDRIYADKSIQPHHCYYYVIIAKNTIDDILYNEVLQGKSTASYAVLNHLKAGG